MGICSWWCRLGCCGLCIWSFCCVSFWGSVCIMCVVFVLFLFILWCFVLVFRFGYFLGRCVFLVFWLWVDVVGILLGVVKWERMVWEFWLYFRFCVVCWMWWFCMGYGWFRSGSCCRMCCGGCSLLLVSGFLLCVRCLMWSCKFLFLCCFCSSF